MELPRSTEFRQKRTANTMACLLQAVEGISMVVELKDHSTVQGWALQHVFIFGSWTVPVTIKSILAHCDGAMNIDMKAVTIYGSKHHVMPIHCDNFYVQGKFIRFVHFDHYFNASKVIHKWLNVHRKFGGPFKKRTH